MPDLPDRPAPPRPVLERVLEWVRWVGPARLAGSAAAVVVVAAAGYWLVRPPAVPAEARLPFAATTTLAGAGTPTIAGSPVSTALTPVDVVVHVAGAVANPGVYRLPADRRVIDAVQVAGGLAPDAQADAINLAAPLVDGERIYVPRVGEPVAPAAAQPATSAPPAGPVDINRATADELDELPGIGPSTAAAIVAHRDQHGPFASVDDLADVRGIGPAKVEALRGLVTV